MCVCELDFHKYVYTTSKKSMSWSPTFVCNHKSRSKCCQDVGITPRTARFHTRCDSRDSISNLKDLTTESKIIKGHVKPIDTLMKSSQVPPASDSAKHAYCGFEDTNTRSSAC